MRATKAIETCGYCRGSGKVPGRKYDKEGRHRPEWPDQVSCEYCFGTGQCEEGTKLLPARAPTRDA
jgi:DnaJ-class molecular chaperone